MICVYLKSHVIIIHWFVSVFLVYIRHYVFFFFKQKTAYEMRISDWSSDVCSSDLTAHSEIVHAPDMIGSSERPSQAIRRAKTTSMGIAITMVKQGRAGAAVSTGNTGALKIGMASCRERVCQSV